MILEKILTILSILSIIGNIGVWIYLFIDRNN